MWGRHNKVVRRHYVLDRDLADTGAHRTVGLAWIASASTWILATGVAFLGSFLLYARLLVYVPQEIQKFLSQSQPPSEKQRS